MSKPKRDITLGEMQDECKGHIFCSECKYVKVCTYDRQVSMNEIDLTDPPRFTEPQMAFLRGCYGIGIVGIMRSGDGAKTHFFTKLETIGFMKNADVPLEVGETLDLSELFGKDAT